MSLLSFAGKKALVTGAGKGIGRAITKALIKSGAETTAISRTQSDLDSLKAEHPEVNNVCLDISNWNQTRKTVSQLGHFDFLINNAGVDHLNPFLDIAIEQLDNTFDINFKAAFNISQLIAAGMVEAGHGGSIVNISSAGTLVAVPNFAVYSASKGALDTLTKNMAVELGPYGIRVNVINPTVVMTPMGEKIWTDDNPQAPIVLDRTPLRKFAIVADVVAPVMFLLSDEAQMITGVILPVDGGLSLT